MRSEREVRYSIDVLKENLEEKKKDLEAGKISEYIYHLEKLRVDTAIFALL